MGVYTHIGLHDLSSAIELLPAPPELMGGQLAANGNGTSTATKKTVNGQATTAGDGRHPVPAPDVRQLDALWPTLPESTKAGILALITAAATSEAGSLAT